MVVTPTGDVTTYDVKPMSGGRDHDVPTPAGTPYDILTTTARRAVQRDLRVRRATTASRRLGWSAYEYQVPFYPNGAPLFDADSRLLNLDGDPIVDEFSNIKYASGAVLGWDSGRLGIASVPPASSSAAARPGW